MDPAAPPLISLRALTRRFPGVTALDDLTLDLEPGIIGLVGSNGAGKSTLLRILLGLLPPTSGAAYVMGHDVVREGPTIRQFVGYMPEHDVLPPDVSATELVAHLAQISGLPAAASRERTADVLRHVGLYEERYRPMGGYSTGMRQRVKLAQALVHDPRLLLLDEPTNGLDPTGRDDMLELVQRTGREFGIAVIVASHLLGEIERVCDFLVAIEGGRLLRADRLAQFTERTGVLAVEVDEGRDRLAAALDGHGPEPGRGRAPAAGRAARRRAVRPRARRRRRPRAAPRADRAAAAQPRGPVPRSGRGSAGPGRGADRWLINARPRPRPRPPAASTTSAIARTPARASAARHAIRALYTSSLRGLFGIGRSGRSKIAPFTLAAFAMLPALAAVAFDVLISRAVGPGLRPTSSSSRRSSSAPTSA